MCNKPKVYIETMVLLFWLCLTGFFQVSAKTEGLAIAGAETSSAECASHHPTNSDKALLTQT